MDSGIESTESSNGSLTEQFAIENLFGVINRNAQSNKKEQNSMCDSGCLPVAYGACNIAGNLNTSKCNVQTLGSKMDSSSCEEKNAEQTQSQVLTPAHKCSSSISNQPDEDQHTEQKNSNEKQKNFDIPEGSKLQLHFPLSSCQEDSISDSIGAFYRMNNLQKCHNMEKNNSESHQQDEALKESTLNNAQEYAVLPYESRDLQRKLKPFYYRRIHIIPSTYHKEKKLRHAASYNNLELVDKLLKEGVNPKAIDEKKRTALHISAAKGHTHVVRRLLNYGADPNQKDAAGNNPLHLAACTSHLETVTVLLKAGTDVKQVDNQGQSPLHLARSRLKLLQRDSAKTSSELKLLVTQVVLMIKSYLEVAGNKEEVELLEAFSNQLSLSDTRQEVENDLQSLLNSLNDLNLNKAKKT